MNPAVEEKLRDLLAFAKEHNLAEVTWQDKGIKIAFRRDTAPPVPPPAAVAAAEPAAPAPPEDDCVRSPMVGIFRRSVSKDRPPLVVEGNHIKPGDRLGIVECMKIPTDVVAFGAGEITKILVEEGQPVEYGQPLFVFKLHESPLSNGKG